MAPYLLFFSFVLPLASAYPSPDCPARCGDVEIPYPFGVGWGCFFEASFNISCDSTLNPPKAYLANVENRSEIIKIEISKSQVRVKYPYLAGARYDPPKGRAGGSPPGAEPTTEDHLLDINLLQTPYTLSENNSVTLVGCDDFMRIDGFQSKVFAACMAICVDNRTDGTCLSSGISSGNGCCQFIVPRGTRHLSFYFTDMHNHTRPGSNTRLFPWGYAFVGEKETNSFSYNITGLNDPITFQNDNQNATTRPLVLDWRIANQNCNQAFMNSSSYACKANSHCQDFGDGVAGYICRCNEGYEGNPYLPEDMGGCRDINECSDDRMNDCIRSSHCKNTVGGYHCLCPTGYRGDGKKNGSGCSFSAFINVFIGILVSAIGCILLLAISYWLRSIFRRRNKKTRNFKRNGGLLLRQQSNGWLFAKSHIFTLKELEKATDCFNQNQILGEGGRGTVYKGVFQNGRIVAIKKAKLLDETQLEEFINEMIVLSQINNRHVVKLLGCCLESEVPLLVYEFTPNGTLFTLIHDPSSVEFTVTWSMRLKISVDIAGAIAYLHSTCDIPIYHRDIKSSNILLDEKYVAKVSDFGGSRLVPVDHTHLTTRVMGTFGYLDPEYFQLGQFTEKSDVYSFGVLLVELLTGKKAISFTGSDEERGLATLFLDSMDAKNVEKILDDQVFQGTKKEVMAVAKLAKRCLNSKGKFRPTMKAVATELEIIRKPQTTIVVEEDYLDASSVDEPMLMIHPGYDYSSTSYATDFPTSPEISHPLMKEGP